MRPFRIFSIGLDQRERQCCGLAFSSSSPGSIVAEEDSSTQALNDQLASFDLGVVAVRKGTFGFDGLDRLRAAADAGIPLVALVDVFDPENVLSCMNAGASRVLPLAQAQTLLGECARTLCPELSPASGERSIQEARLLPGELRELQNQLRKVEGEHHFLASVLNAFNGLVVVSDCSGKIVYINRFAESLTGYSFDEVKGREMAGLFLLPEEKKPVQKAINRLLKEKGTIQHRNFWLTKDGLACLIDWSNSVVLDAEGAVRYLISVGVDITEQHAKAEALRQSEERFTRIFQASPMGIGIVRYRDARFIDANSSLLRMLNCDKAHLSTLGLVETGIVAGHELQELLDGIVRRGPEVNLERKVSLSARRSLRVLLSMDRIMWGDDLAILVILQDVTERLQAEEKIRKLNDELERRVLERTAALQAANRELAGEIGFRKAIEESTQRLIQILWETPDVVAISNLDGRLMYINKAGRQMFNLSDTDLVGDISLFDFYPPAYLAQIRDQMIPLLKRAGSWRGEAEFLLPDGRLIPISQVLLSHKDAQGTPVFISTVARDISEFKKVSQEIEKAYQRERELGLMRNNLFSMTSHQFRTPLSIILSSAELLEHYGEQWGKEKSSYHLQRIQYEAQRMNQMLNDILMLGRIESISYDSSLETVDFCALIRQIVQGAEIADGQNHVYRLECDQTPIKMLTYSEIVERIFDNLLTNAARYSARGTQIVVRMLTSDDYVNMEVQDEGIGIPQDELELIFQPFHRGSNVADTEGTGLGLLIVEKSLQILGGSIQVQSQLGQGTIVRVKLPLPMESKYGANSGR